MTSDETGATPTPTEPIETPQEDVIDTAMVMKDWPTAVALVAYGAFAKARTEAFPEAAWRMAEQIIRRAPSLSSFLGYTGADFPAADLRAFAALLEETIRRADNPELVEDGPDFHEDLDPLFPQDGFPIDVRGNSDETHLVVWQVDEANNWTTVVPGAIEAMEGPGDPTIPPAADHFEPLLDLARAGQEQTFKDLALAVGVAAEKVDMLWTGTVARVRATDRREGGAR